VRSTSPLKKAIDRQTRIVYFANPNNPTGAALHFEELPNLVNALPPGALLVVDEAYYNFLPGGPQGKTAIDLARAGAPVIAVRTFSKAFGLAALRLGYAVGPEPLIDKLRTFSMADLGINAAVTAAALADEEHVALYVQPSTRDSSTSEPDCGKWESSPPRTGRPSSWLISAASPSPSWTRWCGGRSTSVTAMPGACRLAFASRSGSQPTTRSS